MITAYHKPELDVLAARVSIYCVMRKPMSRTKLYEAIQNALR
jgi:hypothetical protein